MIGLTPWRNTPSPTSILLPSRLTPCMQMRCSSGTSLAPGSCFSTPPSRRLVFFYNQAIHIDWAASVGIFQRPFVVEDQICLASEPVVFKWVARCRSGASTTSECIFRLHGLCIPPGPCCASGIEGNTCIVCGCTDTGSAAGDVRRWPLGGPSRQTRPPPNPPLTLIVDHLDHYSLWPSSPIPSIPSLRMSWNPAAPAFGGWGGCSSRSRPLANGTPSPPQPARFLRTITATTPPSARPWAAVVAGSSPSPPPCVLP